MKKLSILFLASTFVAVSSCKDNSKKTEVEPEVVTVDNTETADKTYELAKTEAEFSDPKVEAIFEQYLKVEAALVNTDATKTSEEAHQLVMLMKEHNADEEAVNAAANMTEANDINTQRENFETLSAGIEDMLQGSLKSGMLYKQYCPMAFNNKGAFWISNSREILNPYFGDKMLKCGRIDAEIK